MCADNNTSPVGQPSTPAATQAAQPKNTTDHEVVLVAEDIEESDAASNLGSSVASSSTTVNSSVLEYRMENGRTYHAYNDGKYFFPNDERENDRLDLQHNLFILTFDNKLATAPPNDPGSKVGNVLDVGTGSGIWAIDFGEEHPDAEVWRTLVCGVDLSAVQPEFVPPNVKFEIDDIDQSWTFSKPFDYIHSRMMNSSIKDWKAYIHTCFDNLSPGGYLELIEFDAVPTSDDGTLKADSAITKSATLLFDAAAKIGRPFEDISRMKDVLAETGFKDVHKQLFKWPTNSWPKDPKYKELGIWNHENAIAGWEGFCMAPCTRVHRWSREEVLILMAEARKEFKDRTIHAYFNM
ncbi:methyltransferase domain-containing protein [Colletotrichum godetiae]|uniref:Methyltransferase domain-containing protein n=1 Tax=Colletotrichum godetiae TaxID=1209918 RepID=A0AAJ0AK61_9PEZI|nr:methyltransferase domain-containing protein [Colletotrichum godetiae]KAK1673892.1 methyltransferase domain-containing protein [Colletotrichum godetiae]